MKKIGIALLALLAFFAYRYYKLHPPADILEKLEEIRTSFKEVHDKAGGSGVTVVDATYLSPETLDESDAGKVLTLMDQIGAYKTVGVCNTDCAVTVYVEKLPWLSWLGPARYYNYSRNGILEEEIVDSIDEAVEEGSQGSTYFYCEKTQTEHWFYCTSNG